MNALRRFLVTFLTGVLLCNPAYAFAQDVRAGIDFFGSGPSEFHVDSFFDVFTELAVPDVLCDPCDAIEAEIAQKEAEIEGLKEDLGTLEGWLDDIAGDIEDAQSDLEDAQADLDEFTDPQNYVESEGRRYDSSDNAAMNRRNANLWDAYKAGDLTAHEYSDEVGKPYDDPDVAKELEKLKKEIKKEMEEAVKDAKSQVEDLKEKQKEWNELGAEMTAELEECLTKLEELIKALEECKKQCKKGKVKIEDLGVIPEERGLFDSFFDIFIDLFSGPPLVLPGGTDTIVERLDPDAQPPGSDTVPIELVELQLQSFEPVVVGLNDPIKILPPPKCQLCDPLAKDIAAKEAALKKLKQELANAQAALLVLDGLIGIGEGMLEDAKENLEDLQNPSDYVESEGRRYDSSDHAAMKIRNQRLWGEYKAGKLSAQGLSDEWAKPFDDPDVAKELEEIKKDLAEELEDAIDSIEDSIDTLKKQKADLEKDIEDMKKEIAECEKKLAEMRQKYEECQKKCVAKVEDAFDDFFDDLPPLFVDGFESGDTTRWSQAIGDTDDKDEEDEEDNDDEGFLCGTLGLFCPSDPIPTLGAFADCVVERSSDPFCTNNFDQNGDGQTNTVDIELVALSLVSTEPITVGGELWDVQVDLSGMDGNTGSMSIEDLRLGSECFGGGPCDGLGVTLPPDLSTVPLDLSGNDFQPQLSGGNDVLLGDPLSDDFIGVGGVNNVDFADNPIPADFFGPGSAPFDGTVDLLPFGAPGPGSDLPPLVLPDPVQPPPEQVPQAVKDLIAKIIRDNPLGPCEQLIINVRRIRIGNRVSYTVTATRTRDESACPPAVCPPQTHFQSIGTGCDACQNGNAGCTVIETLPDGTNCMLCAPPSDDQDDIDLDDGDGYENDGGGDDLCEDISCDDGDECTEDECDPETGECHNTPIDGCGDPVFDCSNNDLLPFDSKTECQAGSPLCPSSTAECQSHSTPNGTCWGCVPKEVDQLSPCREDDRWQLESEAESACKTQNKVHYKVTDYCWGCKDAKCDSPLVDHSGAAALEADGSYECSPVRVGNLTCYDCKEVQSDPPPPQCDDGLVSDCSLCPSNTECGGRNSNGCHICNPVDTGPTCPSGTTASESDCESQCPSDGTCIGEDGCYSCIVVNCPSGTTKNECPSSCSNGCDVVGEQHGIKCYQCKQDCESVCAENDYGPESTDHSNAILSELNGYNCVSGANISIQTATIGDCHCIGDYSLQVDTTPPVCAGTPCGDVECGGSASCPGGPNETITVNCNWGGWEKLQKHQFRPVVGN
ncbi:MAG: hypothetical protein QF793_00650 [Candidatus Peribacteraceae bacterium]|nr:hypothetical protein [Candidatus Peribacteraceae bacterium]|tara:strand:- start:18637 stop:22494 length:3858 start_codon:yes stop_codon:yes gene_type:complete